MSTLTAPPMPFSGRQDAIGLYKAFKGLGCDTEQVVNILSHRDVTQRAFIEQEYRTMYSEELSKRLSSELSGNLKKAVLLWMHDPAGRDATIVREALSGDVIDMKAATEVICSRTSSQIHVFRQAYYSKFGVQLEQDIEFQASGDLKNLLLAYASTARYEGPEVDSNMLEKDAKDLFNAGEKELGTHENTFIRIFSERSWAHLAAVNIAYYHMYGNSLKKLLQEAMKGLGTNDATLTRIMVSRAEIDMKYIKAEYVKKYGKALEDAIRSETSGHYRSFLLSLLGLLHMN